MNSFLSVRLLEEGTFSWTGTTHLPPSRIFLFFLAIYRTSFFCSFRPALPLLVIFHLFPLSFGIVSLLYPSFLLACLAWLLNDKRPNAP